MASTQNPQERQLKTALQRGPTPPVPVKLTKSQTKPSTLKPSTVLSQTAADANSRHSDSVHPQATRKPDQQFSGATNEDALKLRRLEEGQAMHATPVYKRALWLTSDAIVLTLASPFFAVWWIARTIKRLTEPK